MSCFQGLKLLYIGIAPRKPPQGKSRQSRRTLQDRLKLHIKGNADVSTLGLSLGCLLSDHLGLQLRRIGSNTVMTFADGEKRLSHWIAQNVFVGWAVTLQPWELEDELLESLSLPLNLKGNNDHPFCPTLKQLRAEAKKKARELPVLRRGKSRQI